MARNTLLVIDESPLDLAVVRAIFKQLVHVECFEEARPALARSVGTPAAFALSFWTSAWAGAEPGSRYCSSCKPIRRPPNSR